MTALAALLLGSPAAFGQDSKLMLAVLEFSNDAGLTPFEVETLADDVRAAALDAVGGTFRIMTRESMMAMLPPGTDLAQCSEGQCEVEAGRKVGADRVVAGSVGRFEKDLVVRLKLFDTHTADLMAQKSCSGVTLTTLRKDLQPQARALFGALATQAGGTAAGALVTPVPPATVTPTPSDRALGGPGKRVSPVTEAVCDLTIMAKPKDTVLLEIKGPDGRTLKSGWQYKNPSATPGTWRVTASAPGYESEEREVEAPADGVGSANIELKPLGALRVTGTPAGAAVKLTGPRGFADDGGLPESEWSGLALGAYRVAVTRAGYAAWEQEVTVEAGRTAQVAVALEKAGPAATVARTGGGGGALRDNGDGTVTDPSTGLVWEKKPSTGDLNWEQAKAHCQAKGRGWHLPTISELRSLIRGCPAAPACNVSDGGCLAWNCRNSSCDGCDYNKGPAGGCYWDSTLEGSCGWFWSSSPVADNSGYAWDVDFDLGNVYNSVVNVGSGDRCVR
jgi:hypothetical protein